MPRYDFRCPSCGETRESIHPMQDIPLTVVCPCGAAAKRVYQAPAAIHFHGGGFYQNDVTSRIHRRRRPNPGDDLPVEFDDAAARIADAI
jgi:putative FmdB family regulatory protein